MGRPRCGSGRGRARGASGARERTSATAFATVSARRARGSSFPPTAVLRTCWIARAGAASSAAPTRLRAPPTCTCRSTPSSARRSLPVGRRPATRSSTPSQRSTGAVRSSRGSAASLSTSRGARPRRFASRRGRRSSSRRRRCRFVRASCARRRSRASPDRSSWTAGTRSPSEPARLPDVGLAGAVRVQRTTLGKKITVSIATSEALPSGSGAEIQLGVMCSPS